MPKFQPGTSGNPAGRTPGATTWQARMRKQITAMVPEIIDRLREQAASGDTTAAKLLLERALPVLKSVDAPAPINLPPDLTGAATGLLQALGAGRLTPDQAGAIAGVLSTLARVHETTELEQRIAALEDKAHA